MCPFEFFDKILLDSISSWCSPIHLFFSIFSRNSFILLNFWFSSPLTLSLNYKSSVQSYVSKVLSKYSTSLFLSLVLSSRSLLHTATCSSCCFLPLPFSTISFTFSNQSIPNYLSFNSFIISFVGCATFIDILIIFE